MRGIWLDGVRTVAGGGDGAGCRGDGTAGDFTRERPDNPRVFRPQAEALARRVFDGEAVFAGLAEDTTAAVAIFHKLAYVRAADVAKAARWRRGT